MDSYSLSTFGSSWCFVGNKTDITNLKSESKDYTNHAASLNLLFPYFTPTHLSGMFFHKQENVIFSGIVVEIQDNNSSEGEVCSKESSMNSTTTTTSTFSQ